MEIEFRRLPNEEVKCLKDGAGSRQGPGKLYLKGTSSCLKCLPESRSRIQVWLLENVQTCMKHVSCVYCLSFIVFPTCFKRWVKSSFPQAN